METSSSNTIVDSSVLVATFNEGDALHKKALKAMNEYQRPYIVHEYVLLETATILMLRVGKKLSDDFIRTVLKNADFRVLNASEPIFLLGIKHFMASKTKQLSFTDAALLALSKRYAILTFDDALNRAIKKQKEAVPG